MAGASKRTSICLAGVAIVFVVVIIILCVIPNPCRDRDPRPECRDFGAKASDTQPIHVLTDTSTTSTTPGSTSSLTPTTTESTSLSSTAPTTSTDGSTASVTSSTVGDDITSTSTSSVLSTSSTTDASTASVTYAISETTSENATEALYSTSTTTDMPETTTDIPKETVTENATEALYSTNTTTDMPETTTDIPKETVTENATEILYSTITTTDLPETTTENTTETMYSSSTSITTDMPETTNVTSDVSETYSATTDVTQNMTTPYESTISTTASVEMTNATTPAPTILMTSSVEMTNATTPEPTISTTASVEITNATTPEPTISTTPLVEITNATTSEPTISTTASVEMTNATTPEPSLSTTTSVEMTNATTPETISSSITTNSTTTVAPTTDMLHVNAYEKVCRSKMCRAVAARMLDVMDHGNVNPCEDFYQFSCGGVINDHFLKPEDAQLPANLVIKESLVKADRNDPALKELLVFYDSCLNYSNSHPTDARLQQARDVFDSLGYQFKPKSNVSQDDKFDLSVALAKMMKMHFTPVFDIMIDVNEKAPKYTFDFKMTLPAFQSPFSLDLAKDVCLTKYRKASEDAKLSGETFDINTHYDEFVSCKNEGDGMFARLDKMEEAVGVLNLTGHVSNIGSKGELLSGAQTELNFLLSDISKVMPSPPEIRKKSLNKEYEIFTLAQLDDGTVFSESPIVFSEFFKELLGKSINPDSTTIQLYFRDTFDDIFGILSEIKDLRLMQNMFLLLWSERVYSDLVRPVGPAPGSEEYCFNAVTNLMDDAVSYLYLKELPKREALQKKMTKLIKRHIDESKAQLEQLASPAKFDFLDKLEELTGEIPTLKDMEDALLDNNKLSVIENDFVENYASLMKHYRERLYKLYDEELPDSATAMWSLIQFPYKANGVSSYALNKFLIPIAAMAPPFYYGEDVPDYINYAGIGHMIAHELMHGFESTGMEYNYEGKTQMAKDNRLVHLSECIGEELLQNYTSKTSSGLSYTFELHRDLSLNELLADSAATKLTWDTFIEDFISQGMPEQTTPYVPEPTFPPARRRRREAEISYAVGGLRNRNRRVAPVLDSALRLPWQQRLPYLTHFTPMQLYYIKTAQNQCSATDEIDIIGVMENEHLPPRLRVNAMLRNDPMFAKAFECASPSYMASREQCQFTPTGTEPSVTAVWDDPLITS